MSNDPIGETPSLAGQAAPPLDGSTAAPPRGGRRALRALRHRNYRLFFFGQLISVIGTWMQATALPLLIVQLKPNDPEIWLGAYSFLPLVPLVPLALVAGSLADRFSRHKIVILTQTTMMLQAFALAALTLAGVIQIWHVLLLALIAGAAGAMDLPARQALVVEMIDDREDLGNGIALNSAVFNLGRAIGPVMAGLLIAPLGYGVAFIINGVSFLAVIVGLLMMRLPPRPPRTQQPKLHRHLIEGVRYVLRNQTMKILMSLIAVSAFLSMPFITLMPIFVQPASALPDGRIRPAGGLAESAQPLNDFVCSRITCQTPEAVPFGMLMGAFGLGALAGAVLVGAYGERGHGWLLTAGNISFPIALLLFALSRSFWFSVAILLVVGVAFIAQNALANTLLQILVPDQLRGRVMSIYALVFQGLQKAGGMQAGIVASFVGASISVGVGAIVSAAYGLFVLFRWPHIRRLP